MQPMSRFEATATTQLHALIADLRWRVQLLDADIKEEERKAGVFDPANLAYPMLAQTLRGRRDNLQATVVTLQRQLEAIAPSADWGRAA
ncbi:hypothetical protein QA640_22690 [Bradyrhizobium sp. CB82]|uniref:hypothetical protein n=1 Tax=Bradyrhizobium sp. CB82 TaxID=3039159 RepID=UPI0024B12724|nr:hypothetical protein [Bradyrhizobium sp. CB82]WFU37305.1 hypothetical protein QA640_22690 [Bradyrhizobium sp. CB82]